MPEKNYARAFITHLQYSINNAILNILGISGESLYENFKTALELKYKRYQTAISLNEKNGIPIKTTEQQIYILNGIR